MSSPGGAGQEAQGTGQGAQGKRHRVRAISRDGRLQPRKFTATKSFKAILVHSYIDLEFAHARRSSIQ